MTVLSSFRRSRAASLVIVGVFAVATGFAACNKEASGSGAAKDQTGAGDAPTRTPTYVAEVLGSYPHDPEAYTQGLLFDSGRFYESTGLVGKSSIR
jgi:glutamine cyclotransferase